MIAKEILLLFLFFMLTATVGKASPWSKHITKRDSEKKENYSKTDTKSSSKSKNSMSSMSDILKLLKGQDISDIFKGAVSDEVVQAGCSVCTYAISYLQDYVDSGIDEDDLASLVNGVCFMFDIQKPEVCSGYTEIYKHVVLLALTGSDLTPDEFCGMMIEGCGEPEPFNWTVPITSLSKPSVISPKLLKKGAPTMRVLHVSDVHFDPYYAEGSNANCGMPLCCRQTSGQTTADEDKAGYWGDYRSCDLPLRTLKSMLRHINETQKIDYVIWTGDVPAHDTWNNTKEGILSDIHTVSSLLSEYLGDIPIYPALGNHESFPQNSFSPPDVDDENSVSWLYDEITTVWSKWLPDTVMPSVKRGAYYSVLVKPGFRIISLNMNYCNKLNFWLLLNSTDPTNQLSWLAEELQKAEDNGEKVHILGHIPPGNYDCLGIWSKNYNNIINRYENTVTAQFFGHTHNDEFQIFYDKSESTPRPTNIAYIAPPVTPVYRNNPSYRIYTVDGDYPDSNHVILDYETYYLNLTEANILNKPTWKTGYSAKRAYNMKSLQPNEWNSLVERFESNDKLFEKFYRFYTTLIDNGTPCHQRCKERLICKLRRSQSNDPREC